MSYDFCEFRMVAMKFMSIAAILSETELIDRFKIVNELYKSLVDPTTVHSARGLMQLCEEVYYFALLEKSPK